MKKETDKKDNMPHKLVANLIESHYILLRYSMKQCIKNILNSISNNGVLKCDIIIETPESQGLSDAFKPCITSIKDDSKIDSILFYWEDTEEVAFEFMDTDWLIQIVKYLNEYVSNLS